MNKFFVLLAVVFFCVQVNAIKTNPFVAFPGEKVVLEFNEKVSVEVSNYYNLNLLEKCSVNSCPVFENHLLSDSGKKKFVLDTTGVKTGFYAVKITDSSGTYYSSFVVRPDYRLFIGLIIVVLLAVLFLVEKNDKRQ